MGGYKGIRIFSYPVYGEKVIYPNAKYKEGFFTHAYDGPNRDGEIAIISSNSPARGRGNVALRIIDIDMHKNEIITANLGRVGYALSLSNSKSRVAFITQLEGVQLPNTYFMRGQLNIWDHTCPKSV